MILSLCPSFISTINICWFSPSVGPTEAQFETWLVTIGQL